MPSESIVLDPTTEDASNVQLDLTDGVSYWLLEHDYPTPELDAQYASSADSEGELPAAQRYHNRTIAAKFRVTGTSAADLETRLGYIAQKVGKFNREGGTYKRISPAANITVFDVLPESTLGATFDKRYLSRQVAIAALQLRAKPFWRASEVTVAAATESTLPELVFTVTGITGDVPGLARLVVTEAQAQDQFWLIWGLQQRYYDSSASAALGYEAEGRTLQGGASLQTRSGASGGGSNVVRSAGLTPSYVSVLSTQATGAGAHLQHIGGYRVLARVYDPSSTQGRVKLRLAWAEGDFRRVTLNAEISAPVTADYSIVDLGQVNLSKIQTGAQRWEGRILAKSSTVGDTVDIDRIYLVPISEGSGEVIALSQFETPSVFSARDEFEQTAGALAGKTAPTGGVWAGFGPVTGLAVEATGKTAQRTAVSDASRRVDYLPVSMTAQLVQVDFKTSAGGPVLGVAARVIDSSNYIIAAMTPGASSSAASVGIRVGGVDVAGFTKLALPAYVAGTWYSIRLLVDTAGRFAMWLFQQSSAAGNPILRGVHSSLATGGALASGYPGILDQQVYATAATRNYDNFFAAVPTADAAVFASRQLQLRHDGALRQDSAGAIWTPVSKYEGDNMRVPPAGREARTARIFVLSSRNDPLTMSDPAIDDKSAQLFYTPRGLVVPEVT